MSASNLVYVDPEYEGILLSAFLQKSPAVETHTDILEQLSGEIFTVPAYKWLVERFLSKGVVPTKPTVTQTLVEEFGADPDRLGLMTTTLEALYTMPVEVPVEAVDSFRRFLTFQNLSAGITQFFTDFHRSRNVPLAIRELEEKIASSKRILVPRALGVYDYAATWKAREELRVHQRDNPELYPRLRLGIPDFDKQVKMKVGTVTNFLAPMKRYKSLILASVAFAGLLQGFNVLLVVLENTVDLTMARLDSMVTRIGYDRIVQSLRTKAERVYADEIMQRLDTWQNRLKIVKGEPNRVSTHDVRATVNRLRHDEGFVPDVRIWDYLNIAKPSTTKNLAGKTMEDHDLQTQICLDLQAEAKDPVSPCISVTATQSNMGGLEVDKQGRPVKIGAHNQGRSIGIAQTLDNSLAVNLEVTSTEDSGWQPPQIVLSIVFMRDGKISKPDIKLVSEIDNMCIDTSMRSLWSEAEWAPMAPPLR